MTDHDWLEDLKNYWVVILGFVAMIALIVRVIDGQSAGVDRYHTLRSAQERADARIDTLQSNQEFIVLILCEQLKVTRAGKPLPKRCDDVFHGWGY